MTQPITATRRLMHRLVPVLGLLMLVMLFAGGVHHHDDGREHDCAVCAVGHSPAITDDVGTSPTAPDDAGRLLHAPAPAAPRPARAESASSRAPPRS